MSEFHQPVLVKQVQKFLGEIEGPLLDGTIGGGGHSRRLLEINEKIQIIGIDRDPQALQETEKNLENWKDRVKLYQGNFKDFPGFMERAGVSKLGGALLDLGLSSHQLNSPERGFSYHYDGPLDMRMDPREKTTAAELLNQLSVPELARIFKEYGEERWARKIARALVRERKNNRIKTTQQLTRLIEGVVPYDPGGHPARRVFQALRIAVNEELKDLGLTIERLVDYLLPRGRIAIITFHSLEDRVIKKIFRDLSQCNCPRDLPCVCSGPRAKVLTRKPIQPDQEELAKNRRARSSKLRVAEKLESGKGKEEK